ncbi:MAG TPA: hypothetical protein VLE95_00950 [Chlamydiales bacterium]|nr:hypothetical protein [Chlamydiales bacterium]
MSISSISCVDQAFFEIDKEDAVESSARKTQTVWARLYGIACAPFITIVHILRSSIGAVIRDAFIFPLKCSWIARWEMVKNQMEIEEAYSRDFWNPAKPLDPNCQDQAKIREKFAPPVDKVFPIQLKNGKTVEITCRIMQTKNMSDKCYNFIQVSGLYSTIYNNITGIHPYLSAYLNAEEDDSQLPPARFIIISQNNINYTPADMDEAGWILLATLKLMQKEFGEIDQLVAHSLGTVFMSNALKQVNDPKCLPRNICLDRGPISSWEVSKKYLWGLGRLFYLFVEASGWTSDVEQNVVDFCQKWTDRPDLVITGVEKDHYFSGSANLCLGEKIRQIGKIHVLVFNPPLQFIHENAHHNLRPDFLNGTYLANESSFMAEHETLPGALIRHSLYRS